MKIVSSFVNIALVNVILHLWKKEPWPILYERRSVTLTTREFQSVLEISQLEVSIKFFDKYFLSKRPFFEVSTLKRHFWSYNVRFSFIFKTHFISRFHVALPLTTSYC